MAPGTAKRRIGGNLQPVERSVDAGVVGDSTYSVSSSSSSLLSLKSRFPLRSSRSSCWSCCCCCISSSRHERQHLVPFLQHLLRSKFPKPTTCFRSTDRRVYETRECRIDGGVNDAILFSCGTIHVTLMRRQRDVGVKHYQQQTHCITKMGRLVVCRQ